MVAFIRAFLRKSNISIIGQAPIETLISVRFVVYNKRLTTASKQINQAFTRFGPWRDDCVVREPNYQSRRHVP